MTATTTTTTTTTTSSTGTKGVKSVKIQPSAIYSIFDQFQRRSELCTGRLIGAIFGTREEDSEGLITVSQAFPIPHSEINDQVNINSEYYKNRAELLRTCYGRSQYILGWYSIALKESIKRNENFSITSSFIHDVFSKEIIKSSPVNVADSALHLEIVIEDGDDSGIKYSALMAAGKNGNIFDFLPVPNCEIEYSKEETFVSRSLLHSLNGVVDGPVAFPSAKEINEATLKEFAELMEKLKSTSSAADSEELLKHLPDSAAYKKQAERIKNDLRGIHEMVKLLCDQLKESQKLYLQSN